MRARSPGVIPPASSDHRLDLALMLRQSAQIGDPPHASARLIDSNIVRGVTYQSRKRTAAAFVNNVIVSGTFKKICGRTPPDNRINLDGKPDDIRLPRDIT